MNIVTITEDAFPMLFNVLLREGIQVECPGAMYNKETKTTSKCTQRVWINRVKKEGPNCNKLFLSCFKDKGGCGYFGTIESSDAQGKPLTIKEGKWNTSHRKHCSTTAVPTESILSLLSPENKEMSPEAIAEHCSKFIIDHIRQANLDKTKTESVLTGVKRSLDETFTDIPVTPKSAPVPKKAKLEEEEDIMEKTD